MYFKQLELVGFKSFADRVTVRLEPGVTAFVGPNGCGKSNLLDALRWVLGEQNPRELRGTHMQDVIFNGSESRQPAGMSEVSVTFDNSDSRLPVDFAEVQVTRRIYRSGESEYLLNKAPCRLRDIQELFMDTGIGTHAYSMVGQGKMDLILSSRPEDRRCLFEEAAGVIKYKTRKRVAMRRLESAEQNLLRLSDIIAEVQRQMRSLKRQVNAAVRYRELSDELRGLEIRAAWIEFQKLSDEILDLRKRFAVARDAYEGHSARISVLEARHEELGLAGLELERTLQERRGSVYQADAEIEKAERQLALLRQKMEFAKEQREQALRDHEALQQRRADIEAESAQTRTQAAALRKDVDAAAARLETRQQDHVASTHRVAEADALLETARTRTVEALNSRNRALAEAESLGARISHLMAQREALASQRQSVEQGRAEVEAQIHACRQKEAEVRAARAQLEMRRTEMDREHTDRSRELGALEEQWRALRERKSSIEARLTSLRELRDAYEGYAAGVRAIMHARTDPAVNLQGIIGPAGDLLSAEGSYERAIEAALGGSINNVVVENAETAKAAIQYLKTHLSGRVTFLPLDIIRGGHRLEQGSFENRPGIIGAAIDFVRFDEAIRPAVEYLLHGTLIVATLDDAIRIAREATSFPRLVTLEGEVVSSAGAVTGGSIRHEGRGLLGRSAEIAELEEEVKRAEAEEERLTEQRQAVSGALGDLGAALRELAEEDAARQADLNELGVVLARYAAERNALAETDRNLEQRGDEALAEIGRLEEARAETVARAQRLEEEFTALQEQAAGALEAASQARQAATACAGELADLRVQLAGLHQQLEGLQRDEARLLREAEQLAQEAARRRQLADQLESDQAALQQELRRGIEQARTLNEVKEQAQRGVAEAESRRQTLLDETDAVDKELRACREQARQAQAEVHQLELDLRRDEDRVEYFQERIRTDYGVLLSALTAEQVGSDEYDDAARQEMVANLRDRLQRMGEVNLTAIEEYKTLEERNDFLTAQAEDLRTAREALLGVIARSDKKIREMFLDTFRKVGEYFHDFFRRLFNGGQARIYLLDEDDPLESGIEIEARPPGKKPQSISLLSGGESALTAIALLFSIFKAKPSPFCILDEVDAPLDDTNVGRFTTLLDEFTKDSQFVIITHNKQTMARANVLYGVTMQERGVSQMVSVKLDEARTVETAA